MAAAEPMMAKKKMAMGRAAAMDDLAGGDDMMGGPVGFPMRHRDFQRPRPRPVEPWAPVRVFPQPTYQPDYVGPRTDFRRRSSGLHRSRPARTAKPSFRLCCPTQ